MCLGTQTLLASPTTSTRSRLALKIKNPPNFTSGSYTVKDSCITDGEDPRDKTRKDEKQLTPDKNGWAELAWDLGRSASGTVADWFNRRFLSSENTFGHGAGELNFAFQGTLKLVFDSNITMYFDDVYFAQGRSALANNWWFAIKGAEQAGAGWIRRTDRSGGRTVEFRRGGGGTQGTQPDDQVWISWDWDDLAEQTRNGFSASVQHHDQHNGHTREA